jgi:IS5 family transposase
MNERQIGIFDESDRLEKLSKLGDHLERLNAIINWNGFRPLIEKALAKEAKGPGGRPSFDNVLMFKILILQRLYNISDDQTEYQINDRRSFMRFLDLHPEDTVPDAKTIWHFRAAIAKADIIEMLFQLFEDELEATGIITHKGTIVDATFVDAPRQRNTREENKTIKDGGVPDDWKEPTPKAKHKLSQKDTEARWTKKGNETHYGYKDHAKVDADSKMIVDYSVTPANVHDSDEFVDFIDGTDNVVYADSAYKSEAIDGLLPAGVKNQIHERAYRNKPLTDEQKASNREKSKVRVRIEHVFGYITGAMHGITVRSIGLERASYWVDQPCI